MSTGSSVGAYFLARVTFDLILIFKGAYLYIMLFTIMTDPPGRSGKFYIVISIYK